MLHWLDDKNGWLPEQKRWQKVRKRERWLEKQKEERARDGNKKTAPAKDMETDITVDKDALAKEMQWNPYFVDVTEEVWVWKNHC